MLYIVYQAPPASAVILRLFKKETIALQQSHKIQSKVICSLFSKMFLYLQTSNTSFRFRFYFAPMPFFAKISRGKNFNDEKKRMETFAIEKKKRLCAIKKKKEKNQLTTHNKWITTQHTTSIRLRARTTSFFYI